MSTPRWLSLPSCATATTLDVNGARLAALDARPPKHTRDTAVLVPGYTGSKEDFLPLLEGLTEAGHRVVAYDQRGQYESSGGHRPDAYGVDGLAADLLGVLDAVADGPVHVVGHSFGGLVSRRAALELPQAFRTLTLLDSGPDALPGPRAERIRTLRPLLVDGGKDAVWQHMIAESSGGTPVPDEVGAFVQARFQGNDENGLLVMGDALLVEPDRVPDLAGTAIPMLVAHGDADDAWPPAAQQDMAARLGARHQVIAGALHSPNVEQPEQTIRVLLEFWASVESAREAGPRDA